MGIQISGLLSGSAFDWKSVVDQLIAADSIPIQTLQQNQATNNSQIAALGDINTGLLNLQSSVQSLRANNPFQNRTVSSSDPNSTWRATSTAGAPVGTYTFDVQTLATATTVTGSSHIGADLSNSTDVSALTLSSINTATAFTSSTDSFFTVNGSQIHISSTDSLQTVFDLISSQTGGAVTAGYDPTTDKVTLTDTSGVITLGAVNDTSNFLQVLKLNNDGGISGTDSITSTGTLGTVEPAVTLANAHLAKSITAVDGSGNGTFYVNGVAISYNVNSDSLTSVLTKINSSTAGVNASYDSANDRVVFTNKNTGFTGLTVSDSSGGLLDAIGVTTSGSMSGTVQNGTNAKFSLNGGTTWMTSASNTLDSSSHGISGLSVTVNSTGTQTLTIASDTQSMTTAIQDYLDKFNALQDVINQDTNIAVSGGTVTTSVLSNNREVQDWATQLQNMAFGTVSGLTGTVTHLDDLGIDFDGTTGHLIVKDSSKLSNALETHPDDVQAYFMGNANSIVNVMYDTLTNMQTSDHNQQDDITSANTDLTNQITTMQTRLGQERTDLTNSFIQMLDAQSSAQSQQQSLTSQFFSNSSCWVARAVYGENNPRWMLFRHWLFAYAPAWFRALYLRHGEGFAGWLRDKPWLKAAIRRWMDARIATLRSV